MFTCAGLALLPGLNLLKKSSQDNVFCEEQNVYSPALVGEPALSLVFIRENQALVAGMPVDTNRDLGKEGWLTSHINTSCFLQGITL